MTPSAGSPIGGRFAGRRALVTGASRGIGAALAQRLAAEGADVALVARTEREGDHRLNGSLAETAARLPGRGGRVAILPCDLNDPDARAGLVERAEVALGGGLDILVNNAAAATYHPLLDYPLRRSRLTFEVNVHAPLDLIQQAVPGMRERGRGWIVNVSSASARIQPGPPFALVPPGTAMAVYAASKAALNRITNGLAAEFLDDGIRVNTVQPRSAVRSEGAEAIVGDTLLPEQVEPMQAMVEAMLILCDCPVELTGRVCVSLDLLAETGVEVRDLDGLAAATPGATQ